ncbi:MAG: 3-hydroxyacyl-CoA dehydrogenase NAD-binding domain-containing protein, partial [Boseongicola sp.]
MTDFTYELHDDGVAVVTWDVPGKSMNVLTREAFDLIDGFVDRALADDAVKGIVITSGKDTFAGGMDLNVLASIRDQSGDNPAPDLFEFVMNGHRIMRKLERAGLDPKTNKGGKPVACAIPGLCAGIGTEIALACHRRFMADTPTGKIGLPEILVGLFPGGGGTTRYSRMVGAMAAVPVLLEGKMLDPRKAKSAQLIDEVVPPSELLARAKEWVLGATDADIVKPWDLKGWKMPGGAPYHPAGFMTFVGASAMINGRTKGVYPAAKALLSSIYEGALVPFDTALKIEARWFTKILMDPTSSAMIRSLFINKEALEKGANRPAVADETVRRVGILGAGMMGAGIAYVSANAGIDVVLVDREQAAADKGKALSESILDKGIQRKKVTEDKKAQVLERIFATTDLAELKDCDLIVEAVFEDPGVKAEMTKKVEAIVGDDCIFATNTSTLPITELA